MEKDKHKTIVVFRKFKQEPQKGKIIALFPEMPYCKDLYLQHIIMSYMRVGQHGGADYFHIIQNSTPAKKEEYESLFWELENDIGYNLEIRKKYTFKR